MTDRLRVTLLGGLSIALGTSPLTDFTSKKSPALFSYLITTGRPHSREALSALLWGDSSEGRARASLRTVLWDLRQHLADFVVADRQTVAFNGGLPHSFDVTHFREGLGDVVGSRQARTDRGSALTDEEASALEAALSHYRGEFLAGFYISEAPTFESWVLRKREWARQLAIQGWYRLVAHQTAKKAYLDGIDAAAQLLEIAPWQEETHRQLMRLLALNGQRSAALTQYETCRRLLEDELGVEPTMETRLLYNRIKSGRTVETASDVAASSGPAVRDTSDRAPLPGGEARFVGREGEMTRLKRRLSSADSRMTALIGSGGVGKTRLAQELAGQMEEPFEHGVRFIPLGDGAAQAAAVEEWEAGESASSELFLALARALGMRPSSRAPLDVQLTDYLSQKEMLLILDDFDPRRWDAAVLETLLRYASLVRLLVISEEAWGAASEDTLRLEGLPLPSGRIGSSAGGVAPRDLPGDGALTLFLEWAQRADPDLEVDDYTAGRAARLCRLTGGLPLAVELVAATLEEVSLDAAAGRLERRAKRVRPARREGDDGKGAMRVASAYAWETLGSDRRAALGRLAFFEGAFDEEAAQTVAGVGPETLLALVRRGWLRPRGNGRYRIHASLRAFVQAKVKELAWRAEAREEPVDSARMRARYNGHYLGLLKERAAALLSDRARTASRRIGLEWSNVRVAWRQAAVDGELRLLEEGLDGLTRFLLLNGWLVEGEQLLRGTCELLERRRQTRGSERLVVRLLAHRARLLNRQGRWEAAEEAARAAVDRTSADGARARSWRPARAAALVEWARSLYRRGAVGTATERLKEALSLVGDDRPTEVGARAFRHLGLIGVRSGAYGEAAGYLGRALRLYEALDHWPGRGDVENDLGSLSTRERRYTTAREQIRAALDVAQAIGDRSRESAAYTSLSRLARARGDHDRAAVFSGQALASARELGDRCNESAALTELSLLLLSQGEMEEAWKQSLLAVEIARAFGDGDLQARAWLVSGHVFSELGILDEARRACRSAMALEQRLGPSHLTVDSLACLARVSLAEGDLHRARDLVEAVLGAAASYEQPGVEAALRVHLTCYQVLTAVDDPRAEEVLQTVVDLYREMDGARSVFDALGAGSRDRRVDRGAG